MADEEFIWAPVRWRNADGRVVGGFLVMRDGKTEGETEDTYVVGVPDWIAGTVSEVMVSKSDAVVGNVPWPENR